MSTEKEKGKEPLLVALSGWIGLLCMTVNMALFIAEHPLAKELQTPLALAAAGFMAVYVFSDTLHKYRQYQAKMCSNKDNDDKTDV